MTSADIPDWAYIRIADDLAARIASGQLAGCLPGERILAQDYGVAYGTLRHAIATLRERGLIVTRPMLGSFTVPAAAGTASLPGAPEGT